MVMFNIRDSLTSKFKPAHQLSKFVLGSKSEHIYSKKYEITFIRQINLDHLRLLLHHHMEQIKELK